VSLEALWTVQFEIPGGNLNGAVVVLKSGRIYGGDSGYYYLGSYTISGDTISGDVQATHYHGPGRTAFGDETASFSVQLSGKVNPDQDHIVGRAIRPRLGQVLLKMTKRAPLA